MQRFNPIPSEPAQRKKERKSKPKRQRREPVDAQEALARAVSSPSLANYPVIIAGFVAKGVPEDDIKPRQNVFTLHAWNALGRRVRKGEHGVRVATVIQTAKEVTDKETGEVKIEGRSRPYTAVVFHVSQTEPMDAKAAAVAPVEPVKQFIPVVVAPTPAPAPVSIFAASSEGRKMDKPANVIAMPAPAPVRLTALANLRRLQGRAS